MSVSFCWRRDSINTAWKVHRVLHHGSLRVCLQSAAHGRYLAASSDPAPPGHHGHRVVLRDSERRADRILWEAIGSGDAGGYVFVRHVSDRLLRANGRYGGVSMAVDMAGNNQGRMMHWKVETIPSPARAPPSEAMLEQFFPDGAYVRLRSRANGRYLHADEDGVHVDFPPHRRALNMVWRVHRVLQLGTSLILLQNAAYGRYLGVSGGDLCSNVYYNRPSQPDLHWECELHQHGSGVFRLVNPASHLTIPPDGTALMAELIPSRSGVLPPLRPHPTAVGIFSRIVIYIPGDEYGNIEFPSGRSIMIQGRSMLQLRAQLADSVGESFSERMAMCIWGGFHGRLMPLTSDLPANEQTIEVILFETCSQAALGIHYTVVDEE